LVSFGPSKGQEYATHYNVLLRKRPNGAPISILYTKDAIFVEKTKADFSDDLSEGALYLLEMAAGDYEIHRFRLFITNYINLLSPEIGAGFRVEPGKVTYIGRYATKRIGRDRDSMQIVTNSIEATDADIAIAMSKFPAVMNSLPLQIAALPK